MLHSSVFLVFSPWYLEFDPGLSFCYWLFSVTCYWFSLIQAITLSTTVWLVISIAYKWWFIYAFRIIIQVNLSSCAEGFQGSGDLCVTGHTNKQYPPIWEDHWFMLLGGTERLVSSFAWGRPFWFFPNFNSLQECWDIVHQTYSMTQSLTILIAASKTRLCSSLITMPSPSKLCFSVPPVVVDLSGRPPRSPSHHLQHALVGSIFKLFPQSWTG